MADSGDEDERPNGQDIDETELDKSKATSAALKLLVEETQKASMSDDHGRFDELIHRLLQVGGSLPGNAPSGILVESERPPRNSKDVWRIRVAVVLITGLLIAVIYAVGVAATQGKDADGQTIAQYLSLISGLAGISIGWLYGDRTQSS